MPNSKPTEILESIAGLPARYDLALCDVWGVLHNGHAAFPDASGALVRLRRAGVTVILLTNAPRPAKEVALQLTRLGFSADGYDAIVTSGDITKALVRRFAGKPLYHLGPARDAGLFEGTDAHLTTPELAEAVICTGLFDDTSETADTYRATLEGFVARQLPFVCANPDLVVERNGVLIPCAGALAKRYGELGGEVLYAGKPYRPVYEHAIALGERLRGATGLRVLAIGDGIATDMKGAFGMGLDALFIPSEVNVPRGEVLSAALIDTLFRELPGRPVAAIERLR